MEENLYITYLIMLKPKNFGLVHLTRLELAHPKALPPQGSVYTNFTTGAYNYIIVKYWFCQIKNLALVFYARILALNR